MASSDDVVQQAAQAVRGENGDEKHITLNTQTNKLFVCKQIYAHQQNAFKSNGQVNSALMKPFEKQASNTHFGAKAVDEVNCHNMCSLKKH